MCSLFEHELLFAKGNMCLSKQVCSLESNIKIWSVVGHVLQVMGKMKESLKPSKSKGSAKHVMGWSQNDTQKDTNSHFFFFEKEFACRPIFFFLQHTKLIIIVARLLVTKPTCGTYPIICT
jgi:hypothetical protein